MNILRTILWVLALVGFLIFAIYNWQPVELTLWQNLVLETKVPVLATLAFALGFAPMWAYHISVKWALNRRVRALENSLRNGALARPAEPGPAPATAVADVPVGESVTNPREDAGPFRPVDGSNPGSDK